jgi:glycerol-3-phosphate acyltransferase PlsY
VSVEALCWTFAAIIPAAYLLGGVPFGLVIGKSRGVDPRASGSGNIGATNVGRILGKRFFYLVLLLDALKSAIPAGIASVLVHANTTPDQRTPLLYGLWLGCGVAALLGHIFSPFLGFKGGKGVATALGLVFGVFPYMTLPGLVALAVFILTFRLTKYISAGSLAGSAAFPAAYLSIALWRGWDPFGRQWPLLAILVLVAGLIVFRHRSNITRLLAGTEIRNA